MACSSCTSLGLQPKVSSLRACVNAIAATILGGTSFEKGNGTLGGTALGVLLISILRNGLNVIGVGAMWQPALIGLVIIAAIVFDVLLKRKGVIQ